MRGYRLDRNVYDKWSWNRNSKLWPTVVIAQGLPSYSAQVGWGGYRNVI